MMKILNSQKKVGFPSMGHYTKAFEYLVKSLGYEPVVPPPVSQKTIKLGVRHSSDMVCFPFKSSLGSLIECLENGANALLVVGVVEDNKSASCRFTYYYHIQEQILRKLGYKFEMLYLRGGKNGFGIFNDIKKINPSFNIIKSARLIKNFYKQVREIDKKFFTFEKKDINIGIVGEAYTLWEHGVNYNIVNKLKKMDIGVDIQTTFSWYLQHQAHIADEKKYLKKEISKYFPKRIGGHGYESLYNTIYYAKNKFDGVIHLLPLSCMPETIVEMPMDFISSDYNIPVYRFPIDENRFEAGFDTRLETFIKLLKRNKKVKR